jgi:transcription initiation factor TFIIIB Brf1 subunit/transcription initiation factor TFIIB
MHIDGIEILSDEDIKKALMQKFTRAAGDLKLSEKATWKYKQTIKEDIEYVKQGKKPSAVVAARIYVISLLIGESRGQRTIAWTVGSCEQSVSELYRIMAGRGVS